MAAAVRSVQSLIGYFDLDPNRALDLILEAFEQKPANAGFLELLPLFRKENFVQVLGFKFQSHTRAVTEAAVAQAKAAAAAAATDESDGAKTTGTGAGSGARGGAGAGAVSRTVSGSGSAAVSAAAAAEVGLDCHQPTSLQGWIVNCHTTPSLYTGIAPTRFTPIWSRDQHTTHMLLRGCHDSTQRS